MGATRNLTHGEAMDRIYRWQRHIYDVTRRYYLLGREDMLAAVKPPVGGSVLEIGCGTASNLIRIGTAFPNCRLFGIDISRVMLDEARRSLQKSGLAHRAELAQADATAFDAEALLGIPRFDRIIMSYTLSMIPDWRGALDQAIPLIAPGGSLHLSDFGQCDGWPSPLRSVLAAWLTAFSVTPREELLPILREHAMRHGLVLTVETSYKGYALVAKLARPPAAQ